MFYMCVYGKYQGLKRYILELPIVVLRAENFKLHLLGEFQMQMYFYLTLNSLFCFSLFLLYPFLLVLVCLIFYPIFKKVYILGVLLVTLKI